MSGRLTVDEAVARYLRQVGDGPECAAELRRLGFDSWCDAFQRAHHRYASEGGRNEWDSRDYSDDELRETYDGILAHCNRKAARV